MKTYLKFLSFALPCVCILSAIQIKRISDFDRQKREANKLPYQYVTAAGERDPASETIESVEKDKYAENFKKQITIFESLR